MWSETRIKPPMPAVLLIDELAGFLGRTCQFALEHRINEAHGKLNVVKEVGDAGADWERHDDGVSVCQGAQRISVEPVVETEHGSG